MPTSPSTAAAHRAPAVRASLAAAAAAALAVTLAGALAVAAPAGAATAAATAFAHTGDAYGTTATVGSVVASGPSAPTSLGCSTAADVHRSNATAAVTAAPLVTSGTVATTGDTTATGTRTSATIQQVRLLGGLVSATALQSVSATDHDRTGYHTSAAGTTFTGLSVAGAAVAVDPAPNTRIALPGVGYVVLDEQVATSTSLSVNAIHVVVTTANALGLAVGTQVVVGHAVSGLSTPVLAALTGYAYGTGAYLGTALTSGPSFSISMNCLGTGGALRTNTGVGVTVPGVLTTGTITNTAQGTVSTTSVSGEMIARMQGATVLTDLVEATVVQADVRVTEGADGTVTTADASSFGSLTVAGHPEISAAVAPNTQVPIAGLGTLYLHRLVRTPTGIHVRMVELIVTASNSRGLAVGSDLRIADAAVGVV